MTNNPNVRVPDEDFLSHITLDHAPCVASDRFLKKVPEFVAIDSICQDEQNPAIVYMDIRLNGVFDYTPRISPGGSIGCMILAVDGDNSYTADEIVAPLVLSYYRANPQELPFNTNCTTATSRS